MSKFITCSKCGHDYFYTEDHVCATSPPQLITAEEYETICRNNSTYVESAKAINDLIASKMKRGHTKKLDDNAWDIVNDQKGRVDTHHILYTTWPIEEEVKECDHVKVYREVVPNGPDFLLGQYNFTPDYCPKCGKKLGEQNE